MKSAGMALCALLIAAMPLSVKAAPLSESVAVGEPDQTEDEVEELHISGYDGAEPGSSIEFEIAPEIASHNPLGAESRTSAATDVSLTFVTIHELSEQFEIEFDAGPSMTFESGDVSGSSLAAALELRTRQNESGFAGFARYGVARDFDEFFDEGLDTVQTLTAGLRYGAEVGPAAIGFELAPRWVNSTYDLDDYLAGELFVDAVLPVSDGIMAIAEMSVDRRWYQNVDPAILAKRRDWRVEVFAGLDFADVIAPASGRTNPIRSLGIGVLWLDVSSNLDSADRSSFKVLPAVTAGVSF
jgi:hypothetical protein